MQPHIFLDELPWDIRSRNTDWRYVRFSLPRLVELEPSLRFTQQRSSAITLRGNAKTILAAVGRRVGRSLTPYELLTTKLSTRDLKQSGANVVFAHRAFPVNAGDVPLVWQSAIVDPEMQRSYGASELELQQEIALKAPLYQRCAAIQVSTEAEARRHAALFPEIAERFVAVPFFLPAVRACEVEELERHRNPAEVRILFVGNHALRKGLDILLEAFLALPENVQQHAQLTVVSSFDRSAMTLPSHSRIRVVHGMENAEVLAEMTRSHIFVNVARFESYGLVFLEAMAQGMACLAPDWEVQREIFDSGAAGVNLPCDSASVRDALERLILDQKLRYTLAAAARARFQQCYASAVVARQYAELFTSVVRR